eukprot:5742936-Prymnesium_polylepis.1
MANTAACAPPTAGAITPGRNDEVHHTNIIHHCRPESSRIEASSPRPRADASVATVYTDSGRRSRGTSAARGRGGSAPRLRGAHVIRAVHHLGGLSHPAARRPHARASGQRRNRLDLFSANPFRATAGVLSLVVALP